MKKAMLKKLPVAKVSAEDIEFITRVPHLTWLMKAKREQTENGQYLVISYFYRNDILTGEKTPRLRTFFSRQDYLSEELHTGKSCWKTGSRRNLLRAYSYDFQTCASASQNEETVIQEWFDMPNETGVSAIDIFQKKVMEERLKKKHRKIREQIEKTMRHVPALPDGFSEWIDQDFMWESRYFFYRYGRRKKLEGVCSQCREKSMVDRTLLRNGGKMLCPVCGKELTARPEGKMAACRWDEGLAVVLQKNGKELLLRFFSIRKYYLKGKTEKYQPHQEEYLRLFYDGRGWKRYEWATAGYYAGKGWVPGRYRFNSRKAVLCPLHLKEALEGTSFAYCGLEEAISYLKDRPLDIPWYLETWHKYPELEKLIKCGFYRLLQDFCSYSYLFKIPELLDGTRNRLYQILRMPGKGCYAALPKEIGCAELAFLQKYCNLSSAPKPAVIARCAALHLTEQRLLAYLRYAPMEKMLDYLAVQTKGKEKTGFASSWADYLNWCELLEYDLKDWYYLFPQDFQQEHDRVYEEYRKRKDKLEKKKLALERQRATLRLKSVRKQLGKISDGQMEIIIPKTAREIEEEGKRLHHCVAGYIPAVAEGKTVILFLRKKESTKIPFRTLEWKDGDFKQCQGKGNREENDEKILKFLEFARERIRERLTENGKVG